MKKITSRLLKSKGACSEQVTLFRELGGDRKPLTLALCLKHATQFNWNWAAKNLLKPSAWYDYVRAKDAAYTEYKRVQAEAWANYRRVLPWRGYGRVQSATYTEYVRVKDAAYTEYVRVEVPAMADYKRVLARAFWDALNSSR